MSTHQSWLQQHNSSPSTPTDSSILTRNGWGHAVFAKCWKDILKTQFIEPYLNDMPGFCNVLMLVKHASPNPLWSLQKKNARPAFYKSTWYNWLTLFILALSVLSLFHLFSPLIPVGGRCWQDYSSNFATGGVHPGQWTFSCRAINTDIDHANIHSHIHSLGAI